VSTAELLERPADPPLAEAAAPTPNPYLEGNFAPVVTETTAFDLPVRGQIPKELTGRFLRIGPNPVGPQNPATYHWFTGTGMAHGLRLNGGRAEWYRNRFIVNDHDAPALGRPNLPGPRNGFGGGNANTNIIDMGGRTYAIVEAGGLPVELTFGLESVAPSRLDNTLSHGFTAHPKVDSVTGELHAVTYQPGLQAISYVTVDKAGHARVVADIPAPHCPMIHDTAFTARFAIILDLPVHFDLALLGQGGFPFGWDDKMTPRIGLLPRSGDLAGLRWIEAPSCYVFHVMNAYDDGEAVVIDVVRHPKMFAREMRGPSEGRPYLVRWRIDLATGALSETTLDDRGLEFPRFNDARAGQSYRYGYTVAAGDAMQEFGSIHKHDVERGVNLTHAAGAGRQMLEPVFVAREGASAEDDGWIMAYVYDANRDASDVVILDAQDFEAPPVATVALPVRVPFGFHGNWIADPA
jgi:carotenoid cleavage dioxygenase